MNSPPDFATQALSCALLSIMFWAACAGIGLQILPRRAREDEVQASRRSAGVAACVGLSALLMIGGIALVLHIPWWLYVVPFLIAGLALAVREVIVLGEGRLPSGAAFVVGILLLAALVVVATLESTVGLRFPLNICDDVRAYLPMARRFLETSGLDEPWSVRRAQSLGGFDLLRAMPVAVFGDAGVGVAETALASVFLAGLLVGTGLRSLAMRILSVGLLLAVPLVWVPRANTTGVLFGTPLVVAVLAATAEARRALRARDQTSGIRWTIAAGLVVAALLSIRPNLALGGAVIVGVGILATRAGLRQRVVLLVIAGASSLIAAAPWSFAMWRTVGTPLYPMFQGNLNGRALVRAPIGTLEHRVHLAADLLRTGPYLWVVLGVFLVALAGRRFLPDATVVVIGAVATVFVATVFALNTPLLGAVTFARYTSPMGGALAVFLVVEMMRAIDTAALHITVRRPALAAMGLGLVTAIVLTAATYSPLGLRWSALPTGRQIVARALRNDLPGTAVAYDAPEARNSYHDALASVVGYRTISALDRPYFIDYRRFDIPNLDAPGYMTPDGDFPFFEGPRAKLAKFRRAGFDVLLVTDPAKEMCLVPARMSAGADSDSPVRSIYAGFLDWEQDIQTIEQRAPGAVRRFGTILRIDLRTAEAELAVQQAKA